MRLCPAQVDGVSIAVETLRKRFIGIGSAGVWDVCTYGDESETRDE